MNALKRFVIEEDGPTAVEYAVLLAMILMAVITGVRAMGTASGGMWSKNSTELQSHGF